MFADFVLKCGMSKKRLHRELYPLEFGRSAPTGEYPIAVAASGGADSMALMLLLWEYLQENDIKTPLLAVTVDHQLRLESRREALEVAKICADRGGIRHIIKVCEWQCEGVEQQSQKGCTSDLLRPVKPRDSKIEEQARQYRYDLLRQLETTLFRLGRASGINGLAGIARQLPFFPVDKSLACPEEIMLVRPLLSVTKDRLMATCDRFQQTWIHDPSNDNLMYDRVRIRQELKRIEKERGTAVLDLFSRFQQTAEKAKKEFARAERSMLRKYTLIWKPELVIMRMALFDDPMVFDELLYRLLSLVIVHIGNKELPPRLASVARLARDLQHLEIGKQLTLGGCRIKLTAKGTSLEFQPEQKKKEKV